MFASIKMRTCDKFITSTTSSSIKQLLLLQQQLFSLYSYCIIIIIIIIAKRLVLYTYLKFIKGTFWGGRWGAGEREREREMGTRQGGR